MPEQPDPNAVREAAERISGRVRETPVIEPGPDFAGIERGLVLKLELFQHTGSFKPRGAFNRILRADVPAAGVVAASGGNFALAVAHATAVLGIPARIFVPESSPAAKVERLRRYPCETVVAGRFYDDAYEASREVARATGALELHAFDDPDIVAGQGTCSMELDRQVQALDTVVVACGGGGLIGGACAWFGDRVRIVAVEPERCPTLKTGLEAGRPVEVEVGGLASDSLGARKVGDVPFALCNRYVDESVLVTDDAIRHAQRLLWDELRLVAEPGGAATVAALASAAYVPDPGERIAALVCGSNADPDTVR